MAASGAITGVEGTVTFTTNFASYLINVYEWTATWTSEFFSDEVFGDTVAGHTNYRGMYSVTGSIKGFIPAAIIPHADFAVGKAAANLSLKERSAQFWKGNAHITDVTNTVNRRTGLNEFSANFMSDGDWTGSATT